MAIRRFSTLALLVVWWIAAAASFTHIRDLAAAHQQDGWVAWAIAISLELVVAMAALEILRDSRVGHRSIAPWLVLLTGAGLVPATNLASAEPAPWGWVLAGWPPVASMAATKIVRPPPPPRGGRRRRISSAALPGVLAGPGAVSTRRKCVSERCRPTAPSAAWTRPPGRLGPCRPRPAP